jgi:hypothetical protein
MYELTDDEFAFLSDALATEAPIDVVPTDPALDTIGGYLSPDGAVELVLSLMGDAE